MNEEAKPKSNPVLRFLPAFAAGLAAGALGMLWASGPRPEPEPPPDLPAIVPEVPEPAELDRAAEKPPEIPRLAWGAALVRTRDDRFPTVQLDANRRLFGPDATNVPPLVSVTHEGRPVKVRVADAPTDRTNAFVRLLFTEPVGPGEVAVRVGREFPDPLGRPATKDFLWKRQYAPEPLRLAHAEADVEDFEDRARGAILWFAGREFEGGSLETIASNLVVSPSVGPIALVRSDRYRGWDDEDGRWHSGWDPHYDLAGEFRAGERYTVRFASPEVAFPNGDVVFASTNAVALRVPKPKSAMAWLDRGRALGGEELGAAVALRAVRVPRAEIAVRRVRPANLVHALGHFSDWGFDRDEWCEAARTRVAESFAPDAGGVATNLVALDDFAAPDEKGRLGDGLWSLEVRGLDETNARPERAMPAVSRLIARSDVALTVRHLDRSVLVWTTRISTGAPVTNAAVRLFARNGAEIGTAVATDGRGVARLPLEEKDPDPCLALAETEGGAYAFLELNGRNYLDDLPEHPAECFPKEDAELDGWIGSDRGIYRHGDRVFLEALVRDATGRAPEPRPVALEVERGDGTVVRRWNLVTDARGRAAPPEGFFEIPDSQPSGTWRARLLLPGADGRELASRALRVEAFVPPKIKVAVEGAPEALAGAGAKLEPTVRADYFFGSPAAGLRAEMFAYAVPAPFEPKGWGEGWRFGAPSRAVGEARGRATDGTTDETGAFAHAVELPDLPHPPEAAMRLRVQGTVFELGGRAVTAEAGLAWHVYPFYVGVEEPERVAPGEELALAVRLAAPDGAVTNAAAAVRASLVAVRDDWLWERRDGDWSWRRHRIEEKVGEGEFAVADGEARPAFRLPPGERAYLLRVEPAGEWPEDAPPRPLTEMEFTTWGGARTAQAGPQRLTITPDRKGYRPGDVARLALRAPFDGLALVTFQQRDVVRAELVAVTNGAAEIAWTVEAAEAPSLDVAASLVRAAAPGEEWPEHRAYGAATVAVEDPAHRLAPSLSPPVAEQLPGGGWRVTAEAALAAAPKSAGAHATFFLVDEAVLGLTREPVPDPAGRFGRARWSGVALYDSFRELLRLREGESVRTAETGGDGGGAMGRRLQAARTRRFVPLARAAQDVAFADGVARAVFELPEFSGEARLVALAWSASAAGAASAQVRLAPALVLEADAPRFLAPGDRAELTLALHSTRDDPATARWSLELPGVATNGAVSLGPKGSATVRVPVEIAPDAPAGELAATFRAEGFGETHAETLRLPLRPAVPVATVAQSVVVPAGGTAVLPAASNLLSATFASLRADADPWAAFAPAVRWLGGYEWRCVEQTTSRAFPLLACGGAAAALAPGAFADPEAELKAAVARVTTMLQDDRITVWPDSGYEVPAYGAWAGLFLAEAEAAGHALAPSASAHLRAALRRYSRAEALDREWNDTPEQRRAKSLAHTAVRTTALLGLRAAGEPDPDTEAALLDRAGTLLPEARAQLALCLLRGGRPDEALELLRATEPDATVRSLAWSLVAWCETDLPETATRVDELRTRLLDARCGWSWDGDGAIDWGCTRDNAAALLAAGAALRRWGRAEGAPRIVAAAPGMDAALTNAAPRAVPAAVGAGAVELRNDGDGPVLVERIVEGAPDPASCGPATNGIAVARRLYDLAGNAIDPASGAVKRGDTIVVEIEVSPVPDPKTTLEDVVVDELLPAGLEPSLGVVYASIPWAYAGKDDLPLVHREVRDDRLVLFARPFSGRRVFRYAAQAVSSGDFALPPLQASEMYRPARNGRTAPARLLVVE
jgi:uncharacterized protein YfaS (alpha-2-macroglobulin family)